jgi:hypothetical protein
VAHRLAGRRAPARGPGEPRPHGGAERLGYTLKPPPGPGESTGPQ